MEYNYYEENLKVVMDKYLNVSSEGMCWLERLMC